MKMDFLLEIIQDISSLFIYNSLFSFIGIIILVVGFSRLYSRVTMGVYKDDQDMSGKTVLITGASDGIGKMTAYDLAKRNARVLLACRNLEKASKVSEEIKSATGNPNIIVKSLDLSSFESVQKCAQNVLNTEDKLDVLINNAGATDLPRILTEDGCELLMQTNYLGHFLLTLLLLDLLKKSSPSRIINISSNAHFFDRFDLNDLKNVRQMNGIILYCNTKLANVLFTYELAERLKGTGVTVNALHPGVVKSAFFRNSKGPLSLIFACVVAVVAKTPKEGAYTTIRLAVDPSLEKTTGKYFVDCKEARTSKKARDKGLAKHLFELSAQVVGLKKT